MRRFIVVAALCVSLPLSMGSSCNGNNDCSDKRDDEAISMMLAKPTCKPEPNAPKWIGPSSTAVHQ